MPITVAEHLQRAFAPRGEGERSPFRPPAALYRCVPLQKHTRPPPPMHAGYGGPRDYADMPPPPPHQHQHHHAPPPPPPQQQQQQHQHQPTPPLPASAQSRGLQPTAQPFVPGGARVAPEPEVPKARTAANGTRWFSADDFAALIPDETRAAAVPDAVVAVAKKLIPQCPSWEVHPYVAGAAGAEAAKRDERGGFFSGKATAKRPERQLHHKVMSVLSRVTPQKYDELKLELLALPIRQADEEQLQAVVEVFFKKAVQEDKFSHLYADLVQSIFVVANEEAAAACTPTTPASPVALSSPTYAEKTSTLAKNLRYTLLTRCQHEFEKPYRLEPEDTVGADGKPLPAEEVAEKKYWLKKKLCGNIRFVGELFRCNIVTPRVINHILGILLRQAEEAGTGVTERGTCDDLLEVFVTLLTTVGSRFDAKCPDETRRFIEHARHESKNQAHSARIRFLLMNLCDLADRNWVELAPGSATPLSSKGSMRSIPASPVTPAGKKKAATTVASTGLGSRAAAKPGMPPRGDTASRSFGNFPTSEASLVSNGSNTQSPVKKKKSADATAKKDSPTTPIGPATAVTIAALSADGSATAGLDSAQRTRVAEARARADTLFSSVPEARQLCERLSTIGAAATTSPTSPDAAARQAAAGADAATSRGNIVRNVVVDAITTRRLGEQRAALPAMLQLLAECPAIETTGDGDAQTQRVGSPLFKPAALAKVVCDAVREAVADGTFEDCPTLFANAVELEPAAAAAKSFANAGGTAWRVLAPGAIIGALAEGIAAGARDETVDMESHATALTRALSAARAGPEGESISKAIRTVLSGAVRKALPEELVTAIKSGAK